MSDGLPRWVLASGYTGRNIYIPPSPNIYLNIFFFFNILSILKWSVLIYLSIFSTPCISMITPSYFLLMNLDLLAENVFTRFKFWRKKYNFKYFSAVKIVWLAMALVARWHALWAKLSFWKRDRGRMSAASKLCPHTPHISLHSTPHTGFCQKTEDFARPRNPLFGRLPVMDYLSGCPLRAPNNFAL